MEAIQRVREEISSGNRRVLLVIATGGGKTVTSSSIIKSAVSKGKRCIFLAHRKELIDQCSNTLSFLGVDHGVIKRAHPKIDLSKPVQIASIQTLKRRDHWDADLIVIDEAHRSMAKTYVDLLDRYDMTKTVLLGLTATPYRMDGKPLGEIYNSLVEVIETQELIDLGFLVNPTVFGSSSLDLSSVSVTGGDYNKKQLGAAMSGTILRGELLSNWAKICGDALGSETVWKDGPDGNKVPAQTTCDACTVAFAPNIKKSIEIVEQFRAAGVPAAHVDGKTDPVKRAAILKDLSEGRLTLVSNVDILCEGWDLPRLECIIGARPTRSKNLYKQMGGRLMRTDDDKRFAFLLDHANWTRTHGFLYEPSVHSLDVPEKRPRKGEGMMPLKECPQCKTVHPISSTVCDECGYEWPRYEIEHTNESLVELNSKDVKRADAVPVSERQEAFDKLATICSEKGYKPNWARVRYQSAYGEWPAYNTGIKIPNFFRLYEKEFKNKLKKQALAHAASEVSGEQIR